MEFLFVLIIAMAVGAVFAFGFRRTGPWEGTAWYFLLLVLGTWAIGSWFQPIGPPLWEVYWVPYLLAAVLLALLMAASSRVPSRASATSPEGRQERAINLAALGGFFWMLLLLFLLALFARYFQ